MACAEVVLSVSAFDILEFFRFQGVVHAYCEHLTIIVRPQTKLVILYSLQPSQKGCGMHAMAERQEHHQEGGRTLHLALSRLAHRV